LQRKIIKLVVTDFSCWVPICVMVFIHFSEAVTLGGIYYVVTAVILLPINSVLNPLLYSDGHGYILEACQRAWRTIRNHFSRFLRSGGFLTQRQGQGNSELVQNENAADSDTGAIPVTTQKMKTKLWNINVLATLMMSSATSSRLHTLRFDKKKGLTQSCKRTSFWSPNPARARNPNPEPGSIPTFTLEARFRPESPTYRVNQNMRNCRVSKDVVYGYSCRYTVFEHPK